MRKAKHFVLLICCFSTVMAHAQSESLKQVRELEPFTRIVAGNGINVKLYDNELEEAEIEVKGVPLDKIITEVEGNTLKVRMKVTGKSDVSVLVKVSYKTLESIEAVTGATVETGRELVVDKIEIGATTGGVVKAEVLANELMASAKAASEVHLYGKSEKLSASAVLGGYIKAFRLETKVAEVSASGGGTVEVYVMDDADLSAKLGGEIRVKGNPYDVKKKSSTGGDIRILNKTEYGKDLIRDK